MDAFRPPEVEVATLWRTILVTDARNSSKAYYSEKADEALVRMERDRALFLQIALLHGGEEARDRGDGSMFAFCDPVAAVQAALAMQVEIGRLNRSQPPETLTLVHRMGVHVGEVKHATTRMVLADVETERHKLSGDIVVTASRLEAICHPGEVCFSNDVYRAIRGKVEGEFRCLDSTLKGFDRPVRCWSSRLDREWARPLTAEEEMGKQRQKEERRLREKWQQEQRDARRRRLTGRIVAATAAVAAVYGLLGYVRADETLGPRLDRAWTAARSAYADPVKTTAPESRLPSRVAKTDRQKGSPLVAPVTHSTPPRSARKPREDRRAVEGILRDALAGGGFDAVRPALAELEPRPRDFAALCAMAERLDGAKAWIASRFVAGDGEDPPSYECQKPVGGITRLTGADDGGVRGENAAGEETTVAYGDLTPRDLSIVLSMLTPRDGAARPDHPPERYVRDLAELRKAAGL